MMDTIVTAARILWDYHCIYDDIAPADMIIGLGSYDTRVAERSAQLCLDGYAQSLLFTGKSGNWTDGLYASSEAEAFAAIAQQCGVAASAIILEPNATNIGENVSFARALLPSDLASAIFVTKPQTQRRVKTTLARQWPQLDARVTAPLTPFEQQPTAQHSLNSLINEMTGDLQRILTYPAKGFQIAQAIPLDVMEAYDFLVAEGFTGHHGPDTGIVKPKAS